MMAPARSPNARTGCDTIDRSRSAAEPSNRTVRAVRYPFSRHLAGAGREFDALFSDARPAREKPWTETLWGSD